MKRLAVGVVAVAVLVAVGVTVAVWRSTPDGPRVVVGSVGDFPVGSVTRLDLEVRLTGYVPRVSEISGSEVVVVPVFLVNDQTAGLLALYVLDPHLGCRVGLASELPSDIGRPLPTEVVFLNPCHGEKYDYLGRYLAGPAPRGLDRFDVSVEGTDVVVDVSAFEYGPDR
ncbi:MAG: Rieske 2Fe-2S domain-containing protein [Chloroflexi bacterium]|nr:Rieske 2Fe-2S domain-containing protein [Chloroflexota bacterium]